MNYKTYSDRLNEVLKACKVQNINANIKRLQDDIISGINISDIIDDLRKYV